jgi:hypothetical protein
MMELKQALEITRDMWAWLAQNPEADKTDWPGWSGIPSCMSDCALCEFTNPNNNGCGKCPLRKFWEKNSNPLRVQHIARRGGFPCVDLEGSAYRQWRYREASCARLALEISNAAAAELLKICETSE